MLVKLGESWVDPAKIVSIIFEIITTTEGEIHQSGSVDEFAEIVNNALSTQSFGGGFADEKESLVP